MRIIRRISAVLIGFVFFLSGILKIMDPVGARLVVESYLQFLHMNWLSGLAGLAGTGFALLEALLGAALITGVWRKVAGLAVGVMTAFFTYRFTDNLSTAIIILGIAYILIFIAHPRPKRMLQLTVAFMIVLVIALLVIRNTGMLESSSSFRMQRIVTWLHPEENQDEGGYQVMQALYAIGSGGLFGKGLGNSAQKLGALPEAQNDMIFSIICEELGIIGAVIVLLLFAFMLARLVFIAMNAPDLLGSLIATGIFAHISLQVVLNIAVVLNLIPTTGITLPFVSYGGTSIAFLMLEMMLALSVSNQIRAKTA